ERAGRPAGAAVPRAGCGRARRPGHRSGGVTSPIGMGTLDCEVTMRTGKRFNGRFVMVLAALVLLVAAAYAGSQQPYGAPFSTEIMKVKEGLYVIPRYDGAATGGNVAVRLTSEGVIIVHAKLPTLSPDTVTQA